MAVQASLLLGIDIGGTHITCATVLRVEGGYRVGSPHRAEVNSAGPADVILDTWAQAIRNAADPGQVAAIGLAMPGPFDYPRGISLIRGVAKYDALYGIDVGRALRDRLGLPADRPIVFENDCNAFVLGEWLAGAAVGRDRVIGFTLGTGFGSGFLAAGEIAHAGPGLPPDTTLGFVPYRSGIAEDYISRRGLRKLYAEAGGDPARDVAEIGRAARAGEPLALQLFAELGTMLVEVVGPFVESFQADAVIIGGAIARSYNLFREPVEQGLPDGAHVALAGRPDTAGLLGAAELARRALSG